MDKLYAEQQNSYGPAAVFNPVGKQWDLVTEGAFSSGVLRVIVFTLAWMTVIPALIIVFNNKNREFARNFSDLSNPSTPTNKPTADAIDPPLQQLADKAKSVVFSAKQIEGQRQLLAALRDPADGSTITSTTPTTSLATSTTTSPAASTTTSPAASTSSTPTDDEGFPIYDPSLFKDVGRWEDYDVGMWGSDVDPETLELMAMLAAQDSMTDSTDRGSDSEEAITPPHPATPVARRRHMTAAEIAIAELETIDFAEGPMFRSTPTPGLGNFKSRYLCNVCWLNSTIQLFANSKLGDILANGVIAPIVDTDANLEAQYHIIALARAFNKVVQAVRHSLSTRTIQYFTELLCKLYVDKLRFVTRRARAGEQLDANNFITTIISVLGSNTDTCGYVFEHGYLNKNGEIDTTRKFEVKAMAPIILRKTYPSMQEAASDFFVERSEMKRYDPRTRKYADITNRDIFKWALDRAPRKIQKKYEKYFAVRPDGEYVYSANNFRHTSAYYQPGCRNLYDNLNSDLASGRFQLLEIDYNSDLRSRGEIVERVTRNKVTSKTRALVFATDTTQKTFPKVEEVIIINGEEWILSSTIHHSGSLAGGHYTAYGKTEDGKYRHYNDSHVSRPKDHPSNTFSTLVYVRAEQPAVSVE